MKYIFTVFPYLGKIVMLTLLCMCVHFFSQRINCQVCMCIFSVRVLILTIRILINFRFGHINLIAIHCKCLCCQSLFVIMCWRRLLPRLACVGGDCYLDLHVVPSIHFIKSAANIYYFSPAMDYNVQEFDGFIQY